MYLRSFISSFSGSGFRCPERDTRRKSQTAFVRISNNFSGIPDIFPLFSCCRKRRNLLSFFSGIPGARSGTQWDPFTKRTLKSDIPEGRLKDLKHKRFERRRLYERNSCSAAWNDRLSAGRIGSPAASRGGRSDSGGGKEDPSARNQPGVVEQQGNPLHGRGYEAALRAERQCPASERQPIRGQWLFRLRKKTAAVIRSISPC